MEKEKYNTVPLLHSPFKIVFSGECKGLIRMPPAIDTEIEYISPHIPFFQSLIHSIPHEAVVAELLVLADLGNTIRFVHDIPDSAEDGHIVSLQFHYEIQDMIEQNL